MGVAMADPALREPATGGVDEIRAIAAVCSHVSGDFRVRRIGRFIVYAIGYANVSPHVQPKPKPDTDATCKR